MKSKADFKLARLLRDIEELEIEEELRQLDEDIQLGKHKRLLRVRTPKELAERFPQLLRGLSGESRLGPAPAAESETTSEWLASRLNSIFTRIDLSVLSPALSASGGERTRSFQTFFDGRVSIAPRRNSDQYPELCVKFVRKDPISSDGFILMNNPGVGRWFVLVSSDRESVVKLLNPESEYEVDETKIYSFQDVSRMFDAAGLGADMVYRSIDYIADGSGLDAWEAVANSFGTDLKALVYEKIEKVRQNWGLRDNTVLNDEEIGGGLKSLTATSYKASYPRDSR